MKVIFLDIDGVLNGYNKWNFLGWKIVSKIKCKPLKLWYKHIVYPFGVHESKVKRLAKIVEATNAKVVMSSSWRHGWWNKPYEEQDEDQKQLTNLLNKYSIEVIDITPKSKDGQRDKEIVTWLSRHEEQIYSFIIIDDEISFLKLFQNSNRFIHTSKLIKFKILKKYLLEDTGLKRKHIKQAIKMLNTPI